MRFVRNLLKSVTLVAAVVLANATYAQKMSDLLVTKDAKPGQWASTPTQIPKGLEAYMKPDSACATKAQLLERLNQSIQYVQSGKSKGNICPTTVVSNTTTEAMMKISCSKKDLGIDAEMTNSIKRTADDTWVFTFEGPNGKGGMQKMQTTMKYLGECRT
jgi:dihydroxyacid dehydratase/phosphogluconate dehydratase